MKPEGLLQTKRRDLLRIAGGLGLAAAAGRAGAQPRTIKLMGYLTSTSPVSEGARLFAGKATERAAGAFVVSAEFQTGLSVPVSVLSRESPMSYFSSIQARDADRLFVLSSVPMLTSSFDEAQILLDVARPYYDAALARFDLVLLAAEPTRPPVLWSFMPLHAARDIKGSTYDLMQLAYVARWNLVLDRLGAKYSPMAAQMMLSWGHGVNTARHEPIFQFFTETFLASQLNFLTVGRNFLAALPAAEREALVEAGRLAEAEWWKDARELVVSDQREIARLGCQVTAEPPRELQTALREAAEPDIRSWAEAVGPAGPELLTTYRRVIGR